MVAIFWILDLIPNQDYWQTNLFTTIWNLDESGFQIPIQTKFTWIFSCDKDALTDEQGRDVTSDGFDVSRGIAPRNVGQVGQPENERIKKSRGKIPQLKTNKVSSIRTFQNI